ncbi:hypothetical protein [Streptomyces sp. NPDC127100]|uniref:hypothetical protein n=1 Tax=Streptomyces sp. NPDC127100 TaxID=3347138 RepID=UPI00364867D0
MTSSPRPSTRGGSTRGRRRGPGRSRPRPAPSVEQADSLGRLDAIPQPRADASGLEAEVAVLNELLAEASHQLEEAGRTVRRTEEQLREAETARETEMEDHLLTLGELEHARAEAGALRALLLKQGRYQDVAAATEGLLDLPASFAELWQRLKAFAYVEVTADQRTALSLDEHTAARTWAAKAWQGLCALESYAEHRQRGFAGGFHQFCQRPPAGARAYPSSQLAMTETEATMGAHGRERYFPGIGGARVEMQAHLKLAGRGNVCPRVHFRDDLAGKGASGLVIVGYIGPHLTNRRTN